MTFALRSLFLLSFNFGSISYLVTFFLGWGQEYVRSFSLSSEWLDAARYNLLTCFKLWGVQYYIICCLKIFYACSPTLRFQCCLCCLYNCSLGLPHTNKKYFFVAGRLRCSMFMTYDLEPFEFVIINCCSMSTSLLTLTYDLVMSSCYCPLPWVVFLSSWQQIVHQGKN